VTLAYAPTAFPRLPKGSGYLVPAVEGRQVKAVTFSTVKWPHLTGPRGGMVVVRCSIGRFRDEQLLQRSDEELRAVAMAELAETCAVGELPIETRVTRWGGGLPQYNVGHADRVGRIRSAIAAGPGRRGRGLRGARDPRVHRHRTRCRLPGDGPAEGSGRIEP
jgi:oxygen-dependent protoporphyrinogen oxidase